MDKDCPWDLFFIIAKAGLIGNSTFLRSNGSFVSKSVKGILGIHTILFENSPIEISAYIILVQTFLIITHVPLQSPDSESISRNNLIGCFFFKTNL